MALNKKKKAQKIFIAVIAGSLPLLASIFRFCMYSFGLFNFLNFIFYSSIVLTAASFSGPLFPIVCVFGLSVFLSSLGMEGRSFYKTITEKLEHYFNIENKESSNNLVKPLPAWKKGCYQVLSYGVAAGSIVVPALNALAKGSAAAIGTIALLTTSYCVITHLTIALGFASLIALGPPGIAIFAIGLIAGITIAAVILGKEGKAFYNVANRFKNYLRDCPEPNLDTKPNVVKNDLTPTSLRPKHTHSTEPVSFKQDEFQKWQAEKAQPSPPIKFRKIATSAYAATRYNEEVGRNKTIKVM